MESFYKDSIFWSLYMVESEHEDSLNSSSKVNTLPRLFTSWWNIWKSNKYATSNSYSWADNFFQIVELKFFWSLPYRSLEFLKIKGRAAMLSGGECCWTILRTIFYTRDIFEKSRLTFSRGTLPVVQCYKIFWRIWSMFCILYTLL